MYFRTRLLQIFGEKASLVWKPHRITAHAESKFGCKRKNLKGIVLRFVNYPTFFVLFDCVLRATTNLGFALPYL